MDANRRALSLIQQLGLEGDLTARLDPPRVGSKAKSPATDPELVRFAYAHTRDLIHQNLFLRRMPDTRVHALEARHPVMRLDPGIASKPVEHRLITFKLLWPEEHDFRPGAVYEIWGTLGRFTIFCEDGAMKL